MLYFYNMNYYMYLQSISFYVTWYSFSLILALICLPLLIKASWTLAAVKFWAKLSLFLLKIFNNIDHNYITDCQIQQHGQIIACRHESTLEILILLAYVPNPIFVYKSELNSIPILNMYLYKLNYISVDRAKKNNGVIDAMIQKLPKHNVIIFPEGTRVAHGQTIPHKTGISVLYRYIHENKLKHRVLLANTDSGKYWPAHTMLKNPGICTVHISDTFTSDTMEIHALKNEIRAQIEKLSV